MAVDIVGAPSPRMVTKQNTAGAQTVGSATFSTTAGSFTAWGQLVASTSAQLYLTAVTVLIDTASSYANQPYLVQIGRGGAGSEVTLAEVLFASPSVAAAAAAVIPLVVPIRAAASSRLAARVNAPNDNGAGVKVYLTGVPFSNVEGN